MTSAAHRREGPAAPPDAETPRAAEPPHSYPDFRAFYAEVAPEVFATAVVALAHPGDAEEVTQDALALTSQHWDEYRSWSQDRLRAFTFRVAQRRCVDVRRAAGRAQERLARLQVREAAVFDLGTDVEEHVVQLDAAREAVRLLDELSPAAREMAILHLVWEVPAVEIAALLDVPPATVRKSIKRTRDRLRPRLTEYLDASETRTERESR
jgi:RNA polymerase sigma factor (sigma-70 family)